MTGTRAGSAVLVQALPSRRSLGCLLVDQRIPAFRECEDCSGLREDRRRLGVEEEGLGAWML